MTIEAIHPITDDDIYPAWGMNLMRLDLPAFGEEYAAWKQTVPADVQKIVLDYMLARQIWKKGIDRIRDQKQALMAEYFPEEEYHSVRADVLGKTRTVTDILRTAPELAPHILAIGVDGSSLYRPHRRMDIDMWVLFDCIEDHDLTEDMLAERAESWEPHAKEVSVRPITPHPITDCNGLMTNVHPFVMPHRITYHSPSYPPSLHREHVESMIKHTQQSKKDLYRAARLFTAVAKSSLPKC